MINLQMLLIIASCVAVVFLIGLILAIAVFTKKPKVTPAPAVSHSADQPESGAAKTTVYCCKACGCVVKKGTRVCPHCGAYIGPNKVRNARILAGVCAVLLCISLAGNFGLSLYVWELNNKVATVSAAAENDLTELKAENKTLLSHRDILRSQSDSWKNKYFSAQGEVSNLSRELNTYHTYIAFVNEWNQWGQKFHTTGCLFLNLSFYICTVREAMEWNCVPCEFCH